MVHLQREVALILWCSLEWSCLVAWAFIPFRDLATKQWYAETDSNFNADIKDAGWI